MNKYIITLLLLSSFAFGQQGKVGINTESPKATLDVNGNVIVEKLAPYDSNNISLVRNEKSKRIMALSKKVPFIKLRFKIKCTDNQDWISDFNTGIPTDKYVLSVLHANFIYKPYIDLDAAKKPNNGGSWNNGWDTFYGISHFGNDVTNRNPKETYNPVEQVKVYKDSGDSKWHLSADFVEGKPGLAFNVYYNKYNSDNSPKNDAKQMAADDLYWEIEILAINKAYVQEFGDAIVSPFGYNDWPKESNGFTTSAPAGSAVISSIVNDVDPASNPGAE